MGGSGNKSAAFLVQKKSEWAASVWTQTHLKPFRWKFTHLLFERRFEHATFLTLIFAHHILIKHRHFAYSFSHSQCLSLSLSLSIDYCSIFAAKTNAEKSFPQICACAMHLNLKLYKKHQEALAQIIERKKNANTKRHQTKTNARQENRKKPTQKYSIDWKWIQLVRCMQTQARAQAHNKSNYKNALVFHSCCLKLPHSLPILYTL